MPGGMRWTGLDWTKLGMRESGESLEGAWREGGALKTKGEGKDRYCTIVGLKLSFQTSFTSYLGIQPSPGNISQHLSIYLDRASSLQHPPPLSVPITQHSCLREVKLATYLHTHPYSSLQGLSYYIR